MQVDNMEVDYFQYCQTCKHIKKKGSEEPCNLCLDVPMRPGTRKPEYYEADSDNS